MRISTKRIRLFLILVAVCVAQIAFVDCGAQQETKQYADYSERSGFKVTNVDSVSVENLMVLAKVWGFAKYHHPVFATETLDADYELFELLPRVAYAGKEERNTVLLEWVRGLGEFKSAEERLRKEIAEKAYTSPTDWSWLEDTELLGAELAKLLQDMRWAKRKKPSRYAATTEYGLVTLDAESGYAPFFSDTGYNLLTMFRLWNMAEYYFPSVNITDKKWADVLPEYIPKFLSAGDYSNWTTAELIAELSDTHSGMSGNPVYSGHRLPVELGFVEGKLIVTDSQKYAAKGEEPMLVPGDEIVSIGGHIPEYFVERARKYIAASNENALLRDAARLAVNLANLTTPVVIERSGSRMTFDVATIPMQEYYQRRSQWVNDNQPYYKLLNDSVGYLYPAKFNNADGAAIMKEFKDTKAIVIDMRCYPDTGIFNFICKYFIPRKTHHVTWRLPVSTLPGHYKELPVSLPLWWAWWTWGKDYKGKIVVLVNADTQSMAEYATMMSQVVPHCVVVGSQTAGADGNIVQCQLPRGTSTEFSGLGVFYPDGTNTQRVGVRIDHYITPTIEGIRVGRDEVLEKALEIVKYR